MVEVCGGWEGVGGVVVRRLTEDLRVAEDDLLVGA